MGFKAAEDRKGSTRCRFLAETEMATEPFKLFDDRSRAETVLMKASVDLTSVPHSRTAQ